MRGFTLLIILLFGLLAAKAQTPLAVDSSAVVEERAVISTQSPGFDVLADTVAKKTSSKEIKTRRKTASKSKRDSLIHSELIPDAPISSLDSVHTQPEIGTIDAAWKPVPIAHSIGMRFGWGMGSIRREPNKENTSLPFNLWNAGVSYRFDIPEQKYVGTISFDLDWMQKGYAYLLLFGGEAAYAQMYDVINLSIVWQPYLPLSRKNDTRFYLIAGPFISYTLGSREREYNTTTGEIYFEREYKMDPMTDYYWNYGITAGAGFQLAFGRFAITIDARYNIQLSDIIRGPEFIVGNPFRTPVDHIGASFGFHYNFIKAK